MAGGAFVQRLGQDAATAGDHGVGGQNEPSGVTLGDGTRLGFRQTGGVRHRQLGLRRRLIDIGGIDRARHDADLAQQIHPSRRGGSQDQIGILICVGHAGAVLFETEMMRPLVRS